jgi:beta-mannanase
MTVKKTHIVILPTITLLIGIIIALSHPLIISQIYNDIKRITRITDITYISKAEASYKDNNTNLSDSINNTTAIQSGPTTNKAGIWHSAMVDESGYEQVSQKAINEFENNSGKKLALVVFSNDWYNGISFPGSKANIIKQNNAVPIIRIAPWNSNGQNLSNAGPYTMSNILNGQHDAALIQWAKAAKTFGSPILIDFGYEPNTNYFPWSKQGAAMYIDAYRHIVTIFRQQNATNVYFVYHPDMSSSPDDIQKWYPGDKYIDWILASAYGEDGNIGCLGVLNKSYYQLTAISPSKPLGIEEWGIGSPSDTKNTLDSLAHNKFPRLKILSIWNEGPAGGKDRRIEQSPEMLNAYRNGIANPFYLSSNFNPTLFQ